MVSRNTLIKIIGPVLIALILITLFIARLLHTTEPVPFDDAWHTISGLGNMERNPVGFYFFQASMVLVGILMIPVAMYVHPRLTHFHENFTRLGSFFMVMGAIGFILTGLIPDGVIEINKLHEITAGLGFGGVLFAALFYWFPLKNAENNINQKVSMLITLLWWIPLILTIITYGYAEFVIKDQFNLGWYGPSWREAGISPFFSFSVWERVLFGVMLAYLELLPIMIPEDIEEKM